MIITADKQGRTDSVYHTLLTKLDVDIPVVVVSWVDDFVFNDTLLEVKQAVLVCFCEYGWNVEIKDSHIWGQNTETLTDRYIGEEWEKFDNWVKGCDIKIQLKRELLAKDITDKVQPIEYPCLTEVYPMQLKEEFNSRPINVFQYWGRSNEHRLRIHSEIWMHGYKKGFQPCDNLYYINQYLNQEQGEKWITLWIPHYYRVEISELMKVNNLSKLSLSWSGSGFKCFRTGEAATNSVMVQHKNEFAWSFPWDKTNCILVEHGKEIEGIEAALANPNLYDIYLKGMQNIDNYRLDKYIPFLQEKINNA